MLSLGKNKDVVNFHVQALLTLITRVKATRARFGHQQGKSKLSLNV